MPRIKKDVTNKDAVGWFARMKSGSVTQRERVEYHTRLADDSEFREVQNELSKAWDAAYLLNNDPDLRKALDQARRYTPSLKRRRQHLWRHAGAVAVLLVALGGLLLSHISDKSQTTFHYITAVGQQDTRTLPDGSTVLLNSGTQIRLVLTNSLRQAHLLSGEATFTVTVDSSRPFEVHTQNGFTRVLGTVFNVEIVDHESARVSVLDGRVEVVARQHNVQLTPGEAVRYDRGGLGRIESMPDDRIKGWHQGRIRFDNWSLREILDEYNRYSTTKRYVSKRDEELRFSGSFSLNNKEELIQAIENAFGVRVYTYPHSL